MFIAVDRVQGFVERVQQPEKASGSSDGAPPRVVMAEDGEVYECSTCGCEFKTAAEHRIHALSAWHRHNMREVAKAARGQPGRIIRSLQEFKALEADSVDQNTKKKSQDCVNTAVPAPRRRNRSRSPPSPRRRAEVLSEATIDLDGRATRLAVHRAVLSDDTSRKLRFDSPQEFFSAISSLATHTHWAVLLLHGGRFAGAVFKLSPRLDACERAVHKAFARYTVRRKQGGSQGGKDAHSGKTIKSAGSSIRRHNEAKLREEVLSLLTSWSSLLDKCDRVFIFAPSRNRQTLYQEGSPLRKGDRRIRGVPVTTGRPTSAEVTRVFRTLATPRYDAAELASNNEATAETKSENSNCSGKGQDEQAQRGDREGSSIGSVESKVDAGSSLSEKEQDSKETSSKRTWTGPEAALLSYLERTRETSATSAPSTEPEPPKELLGLCENAGIDEGADWEIGLLLAAADAAIQRKNNTALQYLLAVPDAETELDMSLEHWGYRTLLHRAAQGGNAGAVSSLLAAGADPTRCGVDGVTPATFSSDAKTRLAFVEFARKHPDMHDWKRARVQVPTAAGASVSKKKRKKRKKRKKKATAPKADPASAGAPPQANQHVLRTPSWQCPACTLANRADATLCDACGTPRGRSQPITPAPASTWSCTRCTFCNTESRPQCEVCGGSRPTKLTLKQVPVTTPAQAKRGIPVLGKSSRKPESKAGSKPPRNEAKERVKRIFHAYLEQLTQGCGAVSPCRNEFCKGAAQFKAPLSRAAAVQRALRLVKQYNSARLCPNMRRKVADGNAQ